MRKCPVCADIALDEVALYGQQVDRCSHCNGIYFDRGELDSIIGMVELFNSVKLKEADINTLDETENGRTMLCPVDQSVMEKRDFGGHVIDICPTCEGVWLDDREIAMLKLIEFHIQQNLNLYLRLGQ